MARPPRYSEMFETKVVPIPVLTEELRRDRLMGRQFKSNNNIVYSCKYIPCSLVPEIPASRPERWGGRVAQRDLL